MFRCDQHLLHEEPEVLPGLQQPRGGLSLVTGVQSHQTGGECHRLHRSAQKKTEPGGTSGNVGCQIPIYKYKSCPYCLSNIGNSSFQFKDDKKKPADVIRERYKSYLENSKQRKRRLWKEKLESRGQTKKKTDTFTDWMYLPDLVLEHIFKYLSYRVSTAVSVNQSLVMMMIMTK